VSGDPIRNERAMLIESALVLSDLHIGVEYELERKGIRVPSQWKAMADEVLRLKEKSGAKDLVINGDLKHGIPSSKWEMRDIRLFMDEIEGQFREIHIVKGNHDGNIEKALPEWVEIHDGSGFLIGDYGILHGHAWPSEELDDAEVLVIGHTHPAVAFIDSLGNSHKEPCWIRGKYGEKEIIVMPAMNRFYGGSPINEDLLGPLLNSEEFDRENADIYLLDGTYLGKIEKIKKRGDGPSEVG